MKINAVPNYTLFNPTKIPNKKFSTELAEQQHCIVNHPKILPQQYKTMKDISFGQKYDEKASLQLIEDIRVLEKGDKVGLQSILERIDNPDIDVSIKNECGDTALKTASSFNHTEIVEKLLEYKMHELLKNYVNLWIFM